MADRYYAVTLSSNLPTGVTEGASATPAAFLDLRITYDAASATKTEVVRGLEALVAHIIHVDTWPPV
jgi:hypothetical protein